MEKDNQENQEEKALTCIRPPYTLFDTTDGVDELMIKNFLNTLAEIAVSVASRNHGGSNQ